MLWIQPWYRNELSSSEVFILNIQLPVIIPAHQSRRQCNTTRPRLYVLTANNLHLKQNIQQRRIIRFLRRFPTQPWRHSLAPCHFWIFSWKWKLIMRIHLGYGDCVTSSPAGRVEGRILSTPRRGEPWIKPCTDLVRKVVCVLCDLAHIKLGHEQLSFHLLSGKNSWKEVSVP